MMMDFRHADNPEPFTEERARRARAVREADMIICIYCGRRGTRGFISVHSRDEDLVDQWGCESQAACERRQKANPLPNAGKGAEAVGHQEHAPGAPASEVMLRAFRALGKLLAAEYPDGGSLAAIARTWGLGDPYVEDFHEPDIDAIQAVEDYLADQAGPDDKQEDDQHEAYNSDRS